jgi:putative Holliday junction resolvase
MRILAVDPGEKKIGLALSDPEGILARPLLTLTHTARASDAERIAALAAEHRAEKILVGLALDSSDLVGPQARRAQRLADAIRQHTQLPVELYDETGSTQIAEATLRSTGKTRGTQRGSGLSRRAQIHAVAAAALLQNYLDEHPRRDPAA